MPRRRQGSVPSLQHHKASGRARVWIKGRDYWLGPWGSPEAKLAYNRLIGEYLATGRINSPRPEPVAKSVAEPVTEVVISPSWPTIARHVPPAKDVRALGALTVIELVSLSAAAKFLGSDCGFGLEFAGHDGSRGVGNRSVMLGSRSETIRGVGRPPKYFKSTVPSSASRMERLGVRSSWDGQQALKPSPAVRWPGSRDRTFSIGVIAASLFLVNPEFDGLPTPAA
jgi:hypothetical protein